MKKANRTRIVESNLSEHIRQENEAYREIERKRQLNEAPMPWCDHCQSYHHETARCINKGAVASPGWPDAFSIKVF